MIVKRDMEVSENLKDPIYKSRNFNFITEVSGVFFSYGVLFHGTSLSQKGEKPMNDFQSVKGAMVAVVFEQPP